MPRSSARLANKTHTERGEDSTLIGAQRIDAKDLPVLLSSSLSDTAHAIAKAKLKDGAFFFVLPSESTVFSVASPSSRSNRRRRHSEKHIPRPRNAFFCFRSQYVETHRGAGPATQQNELSKAAAAAWSGMSHSEKQVFMDQALREQQVHKEKYPDYVFRPVRAKGRARAKKARGGGRARNASSLSSAAIGLATCSSDESPSATSTAVSPNGAQSSSLFPSSASSWTSAPVHCGTSDMGETFSPSFDTCSISLAQAHGPENFGFRWDILDLYPTFQHRADDPRVRFLCVFLDVKPVLIIRLPTQGSNSLLDCATQYPCLGGDVDGSGYFSTGSERVFDAPTTDNSLLAIHNTADIEVAVFDFADDPPALEKHASSYLNPISDMMLRGCSHSTTTTDRSMFEVGLEQEPVNRQAPSPASACKIMSDFNWMTKPGAMADIGQQFIDFGAWFPSGVGGKGKD